MLPSYEIPFGARYRYSIFQSKTSRKTQKFSFAPSARRKMVGFLYGAQKTCQLFEALVVLPPSGKISAGAHDCSISPVVIVRTAPCCLCTTEPYTKLTATTPILLLLQGETVPSQWRSVVLVIRCAFIATVNALLTYESESPSTSIATMRRYRNVQ